MDKKLLWIGPESPLGKECIAFFEKKGWDTFECHLGLIGVEKTQKMEPDIVVVDQELSDCQSLSVVRNIRSLPLSTEKQISIFMLLKGNLIEKIEREHDKWEGQAYFVRLPVEANQLVTWLENPSLLGKFPLKVKEEKKVVHMEEFKDIQLRKNALEEERGLGGMARPTPPVASGCVLLPPKPLSSSQDVATLKEYITLKEKELSELGLDLQRAKEQLALASKKSSEMEYHYSKMQEQVQDFQKKLELLTRENEDMREQYAKELKSREQEIQTKVDKILMAERKLDMANKKYEELKDRVRRDIQQIRIHEKELEARLEILKKDSETLLQAKDKKLLEFRRKMDALEYEIEMLREKEEEATRKVKFWRDRMDRVLRALRLGSSLLESDEDLEELERSKAA